MNEASLSIKDWEAACPYLPRITIDWLTETPELTHRQLQGSLLSVAFSGFSALSAHLAGRGESAAEELGQVVNGTLDRLLRNVYRERGSLLKFGGDAIVGFFQGGEHEARACHAALDMQKVLEDLSPISVLGAHVPVRARMGIGSGTLQLFLIGGLHRELVLAGEAASRAAAARAAAPAGEVVVSTEVVQHLKREVLGDNVGASGSLLLHAPPRTRRSVTGAESPPSRGANLVRAIPDALRSQVLAGGGPPSYRETSIGLVLAEAEDDTVAGVSEKTASHVLSSLIGHLQLAASENGLAFLRSEPVPSGLMVFLGEPPGVSEEGQLDRIISCTRRAVDLDTPFDLRGGVNRGPIFAGHVGPDYRRTYAVFGYAVDRAERLVHAAGRGQLLVTREAVTGLSGLPFTPIGPLSLHGESEPIPAVEVRSN